MSPQNSPLTDLYSLSAFPVVICLCIVRFLTNIRDAIYDTVLRYYCCIIERVFDCTFSHLMYVVLLVVAS
jgi:hypothetical protein